MHNPNLSMKKPEAATNYYRYRYLMGAMQQNQLTQIVRLLCSPEEIGRLDEIARAWQSASARMTVLAQSQAGDADNIVIAEPPATVHARLAAILKDRLFQASFSALPPSFKVVEIDRLVAP